MLSKKDLIKPIIPDVALFAILFFILATAMQLLNKYRSLILTSLQGETFQTAENAAQIISALSPILMKARIVVYSVPILVFLFFTFFESVSFTMIGTKRYFDRKVFARFFIITIPFYVFLILSFSKLTDFLARISAGESLIAQAAFLFFFNLMLAFILLIIYSALNKFKLKDLGKPLIKALKQSHRIVLPFLGFIILALIFIVLFFNLVLSFVAGVSMLRPATISLIILVAASFVKIILVKKIQKASSL